MVESNFPRGTTNQKHYPDLGSNASSVWNSCARLSDVIWRETSGSVTKCRLFSQASADGVFVVFVVVDDDDYDDDDDDDDDDHFGFCRSK